MPNLAAKVWRQDLGMRTRIFAALKILLIPSFFSVKPSNALSNPLSFEVLQNKELILLTASALDDLFQYRNDGQLYGRSSF